MWSPWSAGAKFRTTKISSEGLGGNSTKFCTSENFPLYSISVYVLSCSLDIFIVYRIQSECPVCPDWAWWSPWILWGWSNSSQRHLLDWQVAAAVCWRLCWTEHWWETKPITVIRLCQKYQLDLVILRVVCFLFCFVLFVSISGICLLLLVYRILYCCNSLCACAKSERCCLIKPQVSRSSIHVLGACTTVFVGGAEYNNC